MSTDVLASGWAKVLGGDRKQFNMFIDKMLDGFAYHKIVVDKAGKPVDYVFLEVNHAFEEMTALKREKIVGKKATEVLSGIENDPANWIGVYGRVALTGEPVQFENYAEPLDKYYHVSAYCPEKGYFVALFEDITERKKAEDTLKEAREQTEFERKRLETILETSPSAVVIIDASSGEFSYVNKRAMQLYGFDTLGLGLEENVVKVKARRADGTDYPIEEMPVSRSLKLGEEAHNEEMIIERPDGHSFPIITSTAPLRDVKGNITAAIVVFEDITERKKIEMEIAQAKQRLDAHMNNAPEAVIEFDPKFQVIRWSEEATRIFGWSAVEIIGKSITEIPWVYEDDLLIVAQISSDMLSGKRPRNVSYNRNYRKDGSVIDCEWYNSAIYDNNGKLVSILSLVLDITQRKKAEEALKESEQLYHSVFDNSQDGFQLIELVYDKNGKPIDHKFLKVNHAYQKIIGVKAEDIIDKTAKYISPNQELPWLEVPDRVARTGISEHVELYNKDINKTLDCYYFLYSKNVVGTLFRDITERKRLEKQLQDQERLAAIGATAGMVGHDIRNPLQAIAGDVYLLREELKGMPEREEKNSAEESLLGIEKNVDYINKIVADLQDFARPLKPNAEETDLKLVIEDLLKKNGLPENIKVTVKVDADARKVVADATFINRIMYNLINNAVQAMPKGGKLYINAYKEAKDILITVKDTGVGIPEAVKGKLFTPMFTTKSKGQGFGLAVIKRMTEALGGTVSFESQEGKRTTFTIRLPPKK